MGAVEANGGAAPAYLRNAWYATAWGSQLGEQPLRKIMLEEDIVLYRKSNGDVVALGNRCPHRFVELHRGKVVGDNLQCPYHGLQFAPSGDCAHNPHGGHCPAAAHVRSYPAVERHALVWLWMGEAGQADADLIPDFSILEDANHRTVGGVFDVAADYQLYSDNLLDLSHSEFVHPSLLEEGNLARSTSRVVQYGNTVHLIRDSAEEQATGTFQRMLCEAMGGKAGDKVHMRHDIRWDAPANLFAEISQFRQDAKVTFTNIHIAAPTHRGRSQLLWSATRSFGIDDKVLDDYILVGMTHVLGMEDIPQIESQQTHIANRDLLSLKPVLLPTDEVPVRTRRILAKMIRDEEAAHPRPAAVQVA